MAKAKFVLNRKGVREELLLSAGSVPIEAALVGIAESVKPPSATVYVSRSYGPEGRVVIWLVSDLKDRARGKKDESGSYVKRGAIQARQELQAALNRIGGRFRKGKGRKL